MATEVAKQCRQHGIAGCDRTTRTSEFIGSMCRQCFEALFGKCGPLRKAEPVADTKEGAAPATDEEERRRRRNEASRKSRAKRLGLEYRPLGI